MSISILALVLGFISVQQVCGEVDDTETVQVKEGGFLDLHPGLHDLNGEVQILWTFESGRQSTRVAQMYQGKIYTHYDKRLTGRVQLDRDTAPVTVPAISSSSAVTVHTATGVTVHTSTGVSVHTSTDSVGSCGGEAEALVRLVLSGLVGIATVVFLVDHIKCCTARRGDRSSV